MELWSCWVSEQSADYCAFRVEPCDLELSRTFEADSLWCNADKLSTPKGALVHKPFPSIFVVDDEQMITRTLTEILNKSGFIAKGFTDPREALAAAQTELPDLVVSDVMMPQLSGVDLAIAIQQACPNCKVLLFSGNANTVDLLLKAREKGYDFDLLSKPLHPADLLRHIRKYNPTWV